MSTENTEIIVLGVFCFLLAMIVFAPPPQQTTTEITHEIKITDTPVEVKTPAEKTILTYNSLSNEQKEIVLDTMENTQESSDSYTQTYTYTSDTTHSSTQIASADYIKHDGHYYQVFSNTKTTQYNNKMLIAANQLLQVFFYFCGTLLIVFSCIPLTNKAKQKIKPGS